MARTSSGVVKTDPLSEQADNSKQGEQVRNYAGNPTRPTMKDGKKFMGAYGG